MPADVFISHSSTERGAAQAICRDLESSGISCWMAPRDIPPGHDYAQSIVDAIGGCRVLLVLLSGASNDSSQVAREVERAANRRIPLLPVRLERVEPRHALEYHLAGCQWLDAFPRVEPHLGSIREGVSRLLAAPREGDAGRVLDARPGFHRILASVTAWTLVLTISALTTIVIGRTWMNLVPAASVPLVALRTAPVLLLAILAAPLLAVALQYQAHRSLARVPSLDALFSTATGRGPRLRAGGALLVILGLALLLYRTPPTVAISLEASGSAHYNREFVQAYANLNPNYVVQDASHYAVRIRTGRFNPAGRYVLRLRLFPYGTEDGLEFGEIWLDDRLAADRVLPHPDDATRSASVRVEGRREMFAGERRVLVSLTYYYQLVPSDAAEISAELALDAWPPAAATHPVVPAFWRVP